MSKIFKNKYFKAVLAFVVVLLIGVGVATLLHLDGSKLDLGYPVVSEENPDEAVKDTQAIRQPSLHDFAALLNTLETTEWQLDDPEIEEILDEDDREQEIASNEEMDVEKLVEEMKVELKDVKEEEDLPIIAETLHKKQIINIHKEGSKDVTGVQDFAPERTGKPKIAIVIDDMGMSFARLKHITGMKSPLNFAFLPYAENLTEQTQLALKDGHELIVHVPMMPKSKSESLGPIVLKKEMSEEELRKALDTDLGAFSGYVGINNHMGSDFTENEAGMRLVLTELKKRNLFFLDSKTTNDTLGPKIAREIDLPILERDVFLDHEATEEFVSKQLALTERIAKRKGSAIAIGHPTKATIAVLEKWLPTLEEKGFELVMLTSLLPPKKEVSSGTTAVSAPQ